jgi:hypothetical protein
MRLDMFALVAAVLSFSLLVFSVRLLILAGLEEPAAFPDRLLCIEV